jgi:hypothetical protein
MEVNWLDGFVADRWRPGRLRRFAASSAKQVTAKEEDMSAVLLAIFNEFKVAERVRVELVRDGFPTDRVELTAGCEPGQAGLDPADLHASRRPRFRLVGVAERC